MPTKRARTSRKTLLTISSVAFGRAALRSLPALSTNQFYCYAHARWGALSGSLRLWFDVGDFIDLPFFIVSDPLADLLAATVAPNYGRTSPWKLHLGDFDGDIDEVRISNVVRP
jgi:hypothetical protein